MTGPSSIAVTREGARNTRFTTRLLGIGVATGLLLGLVAPGSIAGPRLAWHDAAPVSVVGVSRDGQRPRLQVPRLIWRDCGDGAQCAKARVPLDYDRPRGRKITLSLIRRLATDPRRRIGSFFLNPGGPGGSAVENVRNARSWGVIGERFDIVGMDPRGVNESTPVRCLDTNEENRRFQHLLQDAPANNAHYQRQKAAARDFARRCLKRNGELLRHLSTANVARDMDLIRQAVGDRQLTYYGLSYGTQLGMTYAAMFPRKLRAMVLDGNIAAPHYTFGPGPTFIRTRGAAGASDTLQEFFRLCAAAGSRCAFSAGGDPADKFADLVARVRKSAITLPSGLQMDYGTLLTTTIGGLYQARAWTDTAQTLQDLYEGRTALAARRLRTGATPGGTYSNELDSQLAIACSESPNPRRPKTFLRTAARTDARWPYAGPWATWLTFACHAWPARDADRYVGSFRATPAYPVLVMNTRHDPITPIRNAYANAGLLRGSRVLVAEGWGHGQITNGGPCDTGYLYRYLIDRTLPPPGTTCPAGVTPFTQGEQGNRDDG